MFNILAFLAENTESSITMIVRIVLVALILIASGFIIFVVMSQSGNSDGTDALTGGGSSKSDDKQDSYYGQNKGKFKEQRLKTWTYIAAGVLAVAAIVFLILS